MAQPTEVYVDPSIASDTGDGSSGTPYGDLQYALDTETRDATNGNRFNVKSGTDEVLSAAIDLTTYGTPAHEAPLIIQGYTSTAGDGGKGGVSGNNSVAVYNDTANRYVHFIDMHLHSSGANVIVTLDQHCSMFRCEIDNTTGNGVAFDDYMQCLGNYFHNIGNAGVAAGGAGASNIAFNYFEDGTNEFGWAILAPSSSWIYRNIINFSGDGNGIYNVSNSCTVLSNSIYSAGGTGTGIHCNNAVKASIIANNLVEGFSGTGGIGIDLSETNVNVVFYGGNAIYDCATEYVAISDYVIDQWGNGSDTNETLSASPFTDAANGDFSPVNTGNVKEGFIPADFGDSQY